MKKTIAIVLCCLMAALATLVAVVHYQHKRLETLNIALELSERNVGALMESITYYQVCDSLNAAAVDVLTLKLSDYQKYRAEDARLINALQTKGNELQWALSVQTETIGQLKGQLRDTVIIDAGTAYDYRCVSMNDKYLQIVGCFNPENEFEGQYHNSEALVGSLKLKYKRFLGFLWETSKIKEQKFNIVSKNPNTKIEEVELVIITK